jgi:Helix-turn-helix of DDE superfamily endonuclease/DDE superfamily endonuclease
VLTFAQVATKPVVLQTLTGLSHQAFLDLLPPFQQADAHLQHQAEQLRPTPRKRQPGGGRKPILISPADRLLFILCYFKIYPLQAVQGFFFGMSQGQACEWIHRLTPVLNLALGFEHQLGARKAATLTQVLRQCPGLEFIIDGTERPIQRPKDTARQREFYSGKLKRHTVKTVVISDRRTRKIKALSRTRAGKTSDKRTADEEDYRFPARGKLYKETGFQGYEAAKVRT